MAHDEEDSVSASNIEDEESNSIAERQNLLNGSYEREELLSQENIAIPETVTIPDRGYTEHEDAIVNDD